MAETMARVKVPTTVAHAPIKENDAAVSPCVWAAEALKNVIEPNITSNTNGAKNQAQKVLRFCGNFNCI